MSEFTKEFFGILIVSNQGFVMAPFIYINF
jgi:hypothetical protein